MRILSGRGFAVAAAAMVVVFGVSGSSWARTVKTRVHAGLKSPMHLKTPAAMMHGEEVVPGVMPAEIAASGATTVVPEDGKPYQLKMTNLHTGESLDIVYRIGNTYLPEALEKLNYFLRDHNTQDVSNYDPKEFDVLHAMMARLGKLNGVIEIVGSADGEVERCGAFAAGGWGWILSGEPVCACGCGAGSGVGVWIEAAAHDPCSNTSGSFESQLGGCCGGITLVGCHPPSRQKCAKSSKEMTWVGTSLFADANREAATRDFLVF